MECSQRGKHPIIVEMNDAMKVTALFDISLVIYSISPIVFCVYCEVIHTMPLTHWYFNTV